MAFVKLEDDTASLEVVVFPTIFAKTRHAWSKDSVVLVEGKVEFREEKLSLLAESALTLDEYEKQGSSKQESKEAFDIEIKIPARTPPRKLMELNKLLKQNQGQEKLSLVFVDSLGREKRIILAFGVDYTKELAKEIDELIKD